MNESNFTIVELVLDFATILIFVVYLCRYRNPMNRINFTINIILLMANLLYPIENILASFLPLETEILILSAAFKSFTTSFALYLSAALAIGTFRIIVKTQLDDKKAVVVRLIFCAFIALLDGLYIYFSNGTIQFDSGLYIVGLSRSNILQLICVVLYESKIAIVIAINFFCYLKIHDIMKTSLLFFQVGNKSNLFRIRFFSLIQVFCFTPGMIIAIYYFLSNKSIPFGIIFTVRCLFGFWGVSNMIAYWPLHKPEKPIMAAIRNVSLEGKSLSSFGVSK